MNNDNVLKCTKEDLAPEMLDILEDVKIWFDTYIINMDKEDKEVYKRIKQVIKKVKS